MNPLSLRPRPLLLLALALTGLLACELAGWPFLRAPLQEQLTRQLQRQVRIEGGFRLHLLGSIRLQADHLSIAPASWESAAGERPAAPFVQASDARLVLPYGTVLGLLRGNDGPLRIRLLEVGGIEARLLRLADGRANWRFERRREPADGGGGGSGGEAVPEFVHLVVHKGELILRDEIADLDLRAQVRTREGSARDAAGLFVRATGHYRGQAFTAEARSPGILPLVAPRGKTAPVALGFSARLSDPGRHDSELRFRGRALDLLRFEGLDGSFRLAGPSLAAVGNAVRVTLPSTAPFFMQGRINKQGGLWQIDVARFEVGATRLSGQFRYDSARDKPLLSGQLRGSRLVLSDLAPALGASPPPAGSESRPEADDGKSPRSGHLLPRREFDIPSLHRMNADVDVALERVDLGSTKLQDLHPLAGKLTLQDGILRLQDLLARTAEGQLQGDLQIDGRPASPLWSGDLHWSGIRLSDWIRQTNPFVRAADKVAPADSATALQRSAPDTASGAAERQTPHFLTGELAGRLRFQGHGRSTAAMLGSLDGQLDMWIREGSISHLLVEAVGLDIAQGLGMVVKGDSNLPLRCAAIRMKGKDGVLHTEAGVVDTPDSLLLLRGQVSLADETLQMRLEARPHDRSPLSVRAPLLLQGTFAAPRVRPELRKVGGKAMLAAALGALLTPLAALLPLMDPGESTAGAGCQATLARLRQMPDTPAAMKRAIGDKK